jgi:RNA polymerase sigma-70 factor (ECF subfamily)
VNVTSLDTAREGNGPSLRGAPGKDLQFGIALPHWTIRTDSSSQSCAYDAELTARFTTEAVPVLSRLLGRAVGMTGNVTDAEDLLQETALKAYAAFRSFHSGTNLSAWLCRIMTNTMIDSHRRTQRRPQEHLVDDFADWRVGSADRHPTWGMSAEAEVLRQLPADATVAALRSLTDYDQSVLYYAYVEGHAYSEIAELLGIPVGTVASRLFNARRRLRQQLAVVAQDMTMRSA